MNQQDKQVESIKSMEKTVIKLQRKLSRTEEQLVDCECMIDRTQHLLNTRIDEVETAREALSVRTQELQESEQRIKQLADAAFEAMLVHNGDRIIECNEAASTLYMLPRESLIYSSILDRVHRPYHDEVTKLLRNINQETIEMMHVRGDGSTIPVEICSRAITYDGEDAVVTAVRDITLHKAMEEKLLRLANSDPLTGVGNRRYFMDAGKREYFRSRRYKHPLSLVMMDIDYFKQVNDQYGHDAGDEALRALANICTSTLRSSDVLARIGGEEFAIIMTETDLPGAIILAERLREKVGKHVTQVDSKSISFTISMGVTLLNDDDSSIETILNRADKGLYQAKETGRNRVVSL